MKVLITGGAGFIGSHVAEELLAAGHSVALFDNLDGQVHPGRRPPGYLPRGAVLHRGDVRRRAPLAKAIRSAEAILHLAAVVGVGQSQYQIHRYSDVNVCGTACLLDILANERHRVRRVVVAGSMSAYGEGAYDCARCGRVRPSIRTQKDVRGKRWDPACPSCGGPLSPRATTEEDVFQSPSTYAITKATQESLVLNYGRTYGVSCASLRFFNVYGPRQALSNPYTGVAAIFLSRIKNGRPPVVYEDGEQTRDFVSVLDIARACRLALEKEKAAGVALNIGTGHAVSIRHVAETLARLEGSEVAPELTQAFRKGDVRHCYPDVSLAGRVLGYRPRVAFDHGMRDLVAWGRGAEAKDYFARADRELRRRGLL